MRQMFRKLSVSLSLVFRGLQKSAFFDNVASSSPENTIKIGVSETSPLAGEKSVISDMSLCALAKREILVLQNLLFELRGSATAFPCLPEPTIFVVVSGTHTGVVLADVPETTIKIVVSGDRR